jgi:hypothetical protein
MVHELMGDLELLARTPIVTSRYAGFKPEYGVPVRITVGTPRYWKSSVNGELESVLALAPYERIFWSDTATDEEMIPVYHQRLERKIGSIVKGLAAIARGHPGRRLVLLCYEDVEKDACHRRWFADWFESHFDIPVPELDRPYEAPRPSRSG